VLVIPEDFRKDQYLLKPIIEAMLDTIGKRRSKVIVCKDPLLRGVAQALNWTRIKEIVERYQGMVDLFLLCVDRDCVEGRRGALNQIEERAKEILANDKCLLAENAWQEIEVWALAGLDIPHDWPWQGIRAECNPKETYFKPYAAQRRLLDEPGEGRKTLGEEAARHYQRVRQLCPEDIQCLENRIRDWLRL
jgi:hypothetical protein